nr:unnamed protein product [Digitaria exilis]
MAATVVVVVPSRALMCWLLLACMLTPLCTSDGAATAAFQGHKRDAVEVVGKALVCFNDRYIYSGCQGSFRLGPQGSLDVPPGSADAFCGGPCLAETELVLRCVDDIMANFRFYNGASAADVRFALDRGCSSGRSGLRGDFDVLRRIGADAAANYGDGYFYGSGNNSLPPALLLAAAILVWA